MSQRVLAVCVLVFALFMDLVDATIVNTALPVIQQDLGASTSQIEWTLSGYLLAFAAVLITGGRLGDIYGRKRVFIIGIVGFTLASLGATLALTGGQLVAARVVQGAFAGVMVPQVLSTVQVLFKPSERGPIYGVIGVVTALGSIAGLVLGGWLVTVNAFGVGWRSIFLVNLPIGALLLAGATFLIPESRSREALRPDPLGVALAITAVVLLVFPLVEGRHLGWPWWLWAMFAAAPVVVLLFLVQQKHKMAIDRSPLLPLQLFGIPGFRAGLMVQITAWIATGSYMLIVGYYLQLALGFTPLAAGLTMSAGTVGAIVVTPVIAPLSKKYGRYLILVGGLVQAAAFLWVRYGILEHGSDLSGLHLALPLVLSGVGMVFMFPPLHDVTLAAVPTKDSGAASGTFTTFQQAGYALGIAIVGVVFFGVAGAHPTQEIWREAVTSGLWVTAGTFALSGLCSFLLPRPSESGIAASQDTLPGDTESGEAVEARDTKPAGASTH